MSNNIQKASLAIRNLLSFESEFRISILRNEARLIDAIKAEPGRPVKYYISKSGLSYRGFYNILQLLLQAGIVTEAISDEDRRVRNLY